MTPPTPKPEKIGICPKEGGKREERRNERQAAIIATASEFFFDNGYAGTTMSAVAAKLGGSKATLWNYYGCKEELFAACMEQKTQIFRNEMVRILDPAAPLRQAVEQFCTRFIAKLRDSESMALYRLLCGEAARAPEASRIFYERGPAVIEAMLTAFFSGHIVAGRLKEKPAVQMARLVFSLCTGYAYQRALLGIEAIDDKVAREHAAFVIETFFDLYGV